MTIHSTGKLTFVHVPDNTQKIYSALAFKKQQNLTSAARLHEINFASLETYAIRVQRWDICNKFCRFTEGRNMKANSTVVPNCAMFFLHFLTAAAHLCFPAAGEKKSLGSHTAHSWTNRC